MGELTSKNKTLIKENQELEAKVVQLASSYAAETSNKESKLEKLKQKLSESGNASSQQLRDLQLKLLETEKLLAAETAKYNQSEREIEECLEEMERMRKGHESDAIELYNVKQSKEEQDKKMQELATNYGQEAQESHRLRKQVEALVTKGQDASQQLQDLQQKLTATEKKLVAELQDLKQKLSETESRLAEESAKYQQSEKEIEECLEEMEKGRKEHDKDFMELDRVQKALKAAEADRKALKEQVDKLQRTLQEHDMDKDHSTLRTDMQKLREQITKTSIENSNLRANEVRSKEKYELAVKRHEHEVGWERDQVKRLKDENRRLMLDRGSVRGGGGAGERNGGNRMDSSYEAPPKRTPLQNVNVQSHQSGNNSVATPVSATPVATPGTQLSPNSKFDENCSAYRDKMATLEKGRWRDGGSGLMKEDALDLAKWRVNRLERQLKDEMKAKTKLANEKDIYFKAGGKWKTAFFNLGHKAAKATDPCQDCKPKVRSLIGEYEALSSSVNSAADNGAH